VSKQDGKEGVAGRGRDDVPEVCRRIEAPADAQPTVEIVTMIKYKASAASM